ncbi:McrB family protein [Lacibacter sediminis]|uniref:ScoMcrA-like N-terminal head domain-containing protein n=1 Tax=Lacibacter sediminis TaxID=2760713 RepID=A0A7G5XGR4_9BACT|nr:hypothetical protein [Lacibacter sediminis]QNA44667.1 hypothetical protein H4075_00275 [Lacibacter sediminis]
MKIIRQITRESILSAIEKINENSELRSGRESTSYDLVINGERYPPILVLSEANKILGGQQLTLNDFGNSTKVAFDILEKLGFSVEKKSNFSEIVNKVNKVDLEIYFQLLKSIVNKFSLKKDDKRLVFSTKQQQLNFIIGQRYCLVLKNKNSKSEVGFITYKQINNLSSEFDGTPLAYYNISENFQDLERYNATIMKAIEQELTRTRSSGFLNNDDNDFRESIFKESAMPLSKESRKVWIEKTLVEGRNDREDGNYALGKMMWSPQKDKRGADIYSLMREVEKGDVIIHLTNNNAFTGVSRVRSKYKEGKGLKNTEWEGPAYLIELEGFVPIQPIDRRLILNDFYKQQLLTIKENNRVFYNSELNLNQGAYITECPVELCNIINAEYFKLTGESLPYIDQSVSMIHNLSFSINQFVDDLNNTGFFFNKSTVARFVSAMVSKPFVILTGLSGSGKTKLAQTFVTWICENRSQFCIVPVGADWTNREPLLGYPNALNPHEYVKPDSGVLDLIIKAGNQPDLPHFLILDEMNLSHVERYFADFLSVMESKEEIPLYAEGTVENGVPAKIRVPSNLFIIGTVNIDETTNMFSPKVLDRANTIEFRVTQEEMKSFLDNIKDINLGALNGKGAGMAKPFLDMAANKLFATADIDAINRALVQFFGELKKTGAEFGYRSATEIMRLIHQLTVVDNTLTTNQKIDIAIMQKLLPKLHGSRRKLCPVLESLGSFCISGEVKIIKDVLEKKDFDFNGANVLYPLSLEKIARMYNGAIDNGFASFAEA